jgi:hypothetical protein
MPSESMQDPNLDPKLNPDPEKQRSKTLLTRTGTEKYAPRPPMGKNSWYPPWEKTKREKYQGYSRT